MGAMTHEGAEASVDSAEPTRWERAAALFVRWRDGDTRAMDELVRLMTPLLWHVVRAYGLDRALAEDVVQTTWLTLVRRHESITEPQAVSGWLTMVARREAWRVGKLQRRADATEAESLEPHLPAQESAEQTAATDDESRRLWLAVGAAQRTVPAPAAHRGVRGAARLRTHRRRTWRCRSARSGRRVSAASASSAPSSRVTAGEGIPMETEDFAADAALFARMRAMWQDVDPVPADLVDRMVATVAVEDLSREYALLTLVEDVELAAVRGETDTATLQFSDGTTSVLRARDGDRGRLAPRRRVGGCRRSRDPARPGRARMAADPGEHGRFAFDSVTPGVSRLRLVVRDADGEMHDFQTPQFEV